MRARRSSLLTATLLAASAATLTVVGAADAHAAAAVSCTDSWKSGVAGNWDTGTNWSKGAAPTSSDVACITAAGSYTVTAGNETITVAGLVVGGSGSTPTFQMGNDGSGSPSFTSTGTITIASGSTFSFGHDGPLSAPEIDNNGTFLVPTSSYASSMSVARFVNAGSYTVQATMTYSLPTSASVFTNTGTVTVNAGQSLIINSPSGQTGRFIQDGLINNLGSGQNLTIADAVEISGGSICGNTPLIGAGDGGAGGSLSFDSGVGAGPACGTGLATDSIFIPNVTATLAGTIPVAYAVTIGDGGPSFANVTLQSATNAGHLTPGFGVTLSGSLVNTGAFTVPTSGYTSTWVAAAVNNTGSFTVNANLNLSLANGATFTNAASGSVSTAAGLGSGLVVNSASGDTGTFVQAGTISNLSSLHITDPLQVNGGSICGNAVYSGSNDGGTGATLAFATKLAKGAKCAAKQQTDTIFIPNVTGTISTDIPKGWTVQIGDGGSSYAHVTFGGTTNSGTLSVGFGATLTEAGTLVNKGTVTVPASGFSTMFTLGGFNNEGKVTILGNNTFALGGGPFTTAVKKTVTVSPGVPLTIQGSLANAGTLTIGGGGTVSTTAFSQASTGTYAVTVAANSEPTYLTSSGAASLAGTVSVAPAKKFKPTAGDGFTLVSTGGAVSGTFPTVKGTFAIHYTSTSVTATN